MTNISEKLDFKKIHIDLEEKEPHLDPNDFKKLPLLKLRNLASEKNLASDTSKLKKGELLKLLGVDI